MKTADLHHHKVVQQECCFAVPVTLILKKAARANSYLPYRFCRPCTMTSFNFTYDVRLSFIATEKHRGKNSPCVVSASVFSEMHLSSAGWRYTLINSLRKLNRAGCTFVTIAGNDGQSACSYLPANLSLPIVVGGSTPALTVQQISNYGPCVDLFAPGMLGINLAV